jgi:hypothetical protein
MEGLQMTKTKRIQEIIDALDNEIDMIEGSLDDSQDYRKLQDMIYTLEAMKEE